jgi:AAHS family 4-hydroxybenzoate transporter-like MFS transporter
MMGIGRFGGIFGSFLVAELSRAELGLSEMFTVIAVPGLIAAAALLIKQISEPHGQPAALRDGQALGH